MRKALLLAIAASLLHSCIPLRIAPTIKDYKITKGKRFKRGLPKKALFIFEDTKDADEFYKYVNTKYELEDYYVDIQVPFEINNTSYYFSFYEVEIKDKSINFIPFAFDVLFNAALNNEDFEPYVATEDNSFVRKGNYYIAIEVFSDEHKDCLQENYTNQKMVLEYLRALKKEYLSTHNYNEVVFKN